MGEWPKKFANLIADSQVQIVLYLTRATSMSSSVMKIQPLKCSIWRHKKKKMNLKVTRMLFLIYVSITTKTEHSFPPVLIAHLESGNDLLSSQAIYLLKNNKIHS